MDIETARRWVSKRLSSRTYKDFLLANLFYDGKIPKKFYDDCVNIYDDIDFDTLDLSDCVDLSYNSLRRPIKKKVNYVLSKPYSVEGAKEVKEFMKDMEETLRLTAIEIYKKGEVWWEYEPDPKSPVKFKITVRKGETAVPHYTDEEQTEYDSVGYIWNKIDDKENVSRYVDFVDLQGRHRYPLSNEGEQVQEFGHAETTEGAQVVFKRIPFIRLTGDSLYLLIRYLGKMYSDKYVQADVLIGDECDPVAVVKNASETDPEVLKEDIKRYKLVKVEGTGDFSYASKTVDYSILESFLKMVKSDIFDQIGVVSRETELNYVSSGRALDRLYVDMDNDAAEMGQTLRNSLKDFFSFIDEQEGTNYSEKFTIIFNTDKPTDETQIISNIGSSSSLLSKRTLLEQHPWVEDVDEELERLEEEQNSQPEPEPPTYTDMFTDETTEPYPQEEEEEVVEEEQV